MIDEVPHASEAFAWHDLLISETNFDDQCLLHIAFDSTITKGWDVLELTKPFENGVLMYGQLSSLLFLSKELAL